MQAWSSIVAVSRNWSVIDEFQLELSFVRSVLLNYASDEEREKIKRSHNGTTAVLYVCIAVVSTSWPFSLSCWTLCLRHWLGIADSCATRTKRCMYEYANKDQRADRSNHGIKFYFRRMCCFSCWTTTTERMQRMFTRWAGGRDRATSLWFRRQRISWDESFNMTSTSDSRTEDDDDQSIRVME